MKKLLFVLTALLMAGVMYAQSPKGFNYQAVVRNEAGRLMDNRYVGIRITIRQGSPTGTVVYQYEDHVQTNQNGLLTVLVGANSNQYDSINWAQGPYFLVSELDPNNGTDYTLVTTQQILSVPYAEYATVADRLRTPVVYSENDPDFHAWGFQYDSLVNSPTRLSQFINDLQLSLNGDTLTIGGQRIRLNTLSASTIDWSNITNRPTTLSQFTNDLTLSLVGDTLYIGGRAVPLSSLRTQSLPWSSITNRPTTLSQFTNDLTLSLSGDTLYIGNRAVPLSTLRTQSLPWSSITGVPTNLSQFNNDLTLSLSGDTLYIGNRAVPLSALHTQSLPWSSITGTPTNLSQFNNDLTLSLSGDTLYIGGRAVPLSALHTQSLPWSSITGVPTNLSQFTNDLTLSLSGDTLYVGGVPVSLDTLRTQSLPWSSITGTPTNLSQFTNDLTLSLSGDTLYVGGLPVSLDTLRTQSLPWSSITGTPTNLSQFTNDLQLTLGNDTLWVGDSSQFVNLSPLVTKRLDWDSIDNHPDSLSQFVNNLQPTLVGDTLYIGGNRYVTLSSIVPTTMAWDSITGTPNRLSQFTNDLPLTLQGTTLYMGTNQFVSLDTFMTRPVLWDNIGNHPTRLSQFINDLPFALHLDTLFIGPNNYVVLQYPMPIHWADIPDHPNNLSEFTNDAGFLSAETQGLGDVVAINPNAGGQIKSVADPTEALDAVNKRYVDYQDSVMNAYINYHDSVLTAQLALKDSLTRVRMDSLSAVIDSLSNVVVTMQHPVIDGMLTGKFSVANGKQVIFSKGNLQYHPKMQIFRFAEHQYDFEGTNNNNAVYGPYCNGWLDLFGFGTSTWCGGRTRYMPYETSTNANEFMQEMSGNDLTGIYVNCDWGRYNAITNGGCQTSQWRTLTNDEWIYLLTQRTDAVNLRTFATVDGKHGMIILPDGWTAPAGVTIVPNVTSSFAFNDFTDVEWQTLEEAGAVFLPSSGYRDGTVTYLDNVNAFYWSSTHVNAVSGTALHISTDNGANTESTNCSRACAVRLVRDY